MFINIDHEKRPSDYKLHLAKPNKEIISVLHEKQNSTLNLKLGNISELNFSIPYFVEDSNLQMIKNPNIEKIRELMYVKLTWGEFEEWFLIDNITESSEDNEIMNIQSFSIGYENKRKKINEFKETAINATEFYTEILKDSPWSIGEIDGSFDLLYRSFDESGTDRFELIKTGAETFGGVIVWDTNNKKINLKEPDNIGEFRGLTVSYDRLMSSLNKTRTTDEMVTRLYVYGNERITIENKNPTNEKYIEDYSYFMHTFKRDANKNVLESSYYMSDSLCHALLDNKELRDEYEPQIKTIQKNIENKNASLSLAMIELNDAEFTLMSAKGLLDIAKAVDDKALIAQRKTEVSNATSIVNTKQTAVNNLTSQIEGLQNQVSVLQNAISVRSFTKELIDELEPYIIEKEIEDARYIDEDELYEFAKEKFSEIREPRVVIETGIEGLMNSVEEQYYWDKLVLGDTMRVRQKRMDIDYKSRIIEMNVGLDDSDVEVKIANFTENVDNLDKFISILYSSESNSTILSNNKHKWDSVVEMRDQVTQLRDSEIDATKKRITAGVNESVEIGERGIVITTPSFPNEMIIMQAGVIALSEDGGETWKTSVTPNGVVAETVIGKLIAGNNLIITNDSGSIVMDGDGLEIESDSIKIMSGGENPKNLIDDWNNMIINMEDFANDGTVTPYEKSQISHQWNMISDSHSKIIESFVKNMGVETPENPYPHEYDDYLIAYENLKEYLFTINQSDGYTLLNPNRMDIASPIDIGTYRLLVRSFTSAKDNFILVMPMEYANAYMEVLESSISLNYIKNDEVVAKINLSEEGTRIDGKLLEINSRTEFNDDLVMNAGLIQDANGDITIDLNKGEINLSKPLTINYVPIATKDDVENIEMAYVASLSNDTALVPTDEDGNEGDYSSAFTSIHIYQRDIDVTLQGWTFSATPSVGINGLLSGNDFTVTSMSVESGYVDVSAIKGSTVLTKRFSISKVRKGETGEIGQPAKIIRLSVDKEIMIFNNDDKPNPTNQTINIEAFIQGMTGNPTFTATAYNGSVSLGNVTTGFSGTGSKRTLSSSSFTANTTHITVTATLSGVTDKISIVKIKNGAQGDSGISPVVGYLTNEAIVLPANSEGIVSNYEMSEGYFRVFEGVTDVSNQATFSEIGLPSDNITINLNTSTGQYVVVDMEKEQSEGFADIKATFKGVEIVKRVSVSKSKQGMEGLDGKDGYTPVKGADYFDGKDGASSYLWIMYSQNANGNPMVDSPTNAKYIGVATTTVNTKPTAYSDYKWSLVKGTDGIPGEPGTDGKTSYLHIKYSDDGTTFTSNNGETEGKWIGVLVDFVETDSLAFSDYTWNKVAGEDGSDAKLLYLSATAETMTFNADNSPNPTTQTVSFTANLQNTTGTATFTATPYNGTTALTNITLGGSGNTRTLTQAQFPAIATRIEIKAVLGGLVDTVSVTKLKNGLDGENSVVGYLTNESISIPTNSSGAFTPANLAKVTGTFRVFDGITEKTTDTSVEFSTSTKVGLNGNITADGIYTVTALTADVATLELKATYKGVTIYKTLTVVKSRAGVDGVSITRVFNEYAVNNSPAIAPTTGWDEEAPSRTSGEYLWVREKVNYSNSSSEITGTRMVTGDKGDIGLDGKNALSVMLLNESQSVASTSGRKATDAQIIKIPFTAFVGTARTSCTASVGTLPSGVTLGSITNGTSSTDGVITLNVAKDATLGGTTSQFDTGSIEITITANDISVKKFFNWTKSVSGVNGTTARTFFTESDVSVIVKKEDGSYTPSSLTFYSYYKDGSTANKTAYARFWKIETTVDGGNWTTYETKVDTASTTYTITSIPQNIVGIRATTYSTNALTSAHDTQSVMVVTDGESGISITNVIAEYSVNNSKVTAPTTGWQETQPNRPEGSFIWRRDRILYSDDSNTITKPVVMTGDKGDSGENAKLLYLSSNLESMIFNSDNTPNPSNQIATIEAKLQNVSGTVVYSATAYNGATSIGNVVLGGTGNTKTLSVNNFPENASHVSVTATLGSLTDTISIFKIRHGEDGFDGGTGPKGDNSIIGYLTNESVTLGASSTGVVSSFTPARGTFRVFDGITEVTTNSACEFSLNTSTGVTLTINSSGVYTVTAMSADTATAEFKAVYKGITIIKTMSLSKSRVGPQGPDGPQGPQGPQGATGLQGPRGDIGTSITGITEHYLATSASSGVTATTSGWTTSIQTMTATNKYLWNYEKINFSDGTNQPTVPVIIGVYGEKGDIGGTGPTGRSITAIQEYYLATSASTGVTRTTSGWTTTMQTTTPTKKYLWNYEKITWSSGTTTTYVEPIIIGIHGEQGPQGPEGPEGPNGISPIVGFLTNESITLPASDKGVVPSSIFASATGTLNVYEGTILRNSQADYSVVSQSSITVSITQSGVYTVSAMTTGENVLSGTATLRADYNGVTIDKILTVTKALAGSQGPIGGTGGTGPSGKDATTYWINASTNAIKKDVTGTIVPNTITFSGFSKTGTSNPVAYAGRFIIQTSTDGVSYTTAYTSSANQSSYTYTVPTTASFVKARYYLAGGTSILLDEQTIPVLVDAEGIDKKYEGQSLLDKTEILSGTEIFTDKADDDSVVHVEIDGKSIQGDSGNLFDIYGWLSVPDSEKPTSSGVPYIVMQLEPRISYTVSTNIPDRGTLYDVFAMRGGGTASSASNGLSVNKAQTVTTLDNGLLQIAMRDHSLNKSSGFWIKVEEGDVATPFNGYANPTPDYPVPIHSLDGVDVVSSVGGENLFLNSNFEASGSGSSWINNLTVKTERGIKYISQDYGWLSSYKIYIEEGIYTLSMLARRGSDYVGGRLRFSVDACDSEGNTIDSVQNHYADATEKWERLSITFNVPAGTKFITGYFLNSSATNGSIDMAEFKIEKGAISTPYSISPEDLFPDTYTPTLYKTNILLSEPLRSVGDVKDRLFRDDEGLWKVERNVGEYTFTDSSPVTTVNGSYNNETTTLVGVTPPILAKRNYAPFSTHFHEVTGGGATTVEGVAKVGNTPQFRISLFNSRIGATSSESTEIRTVKAKTWLASNKPTLLYVLENPTLELLPLEIQDKLNNIASYKGSNYLYTIVDKTNILPEYVRDNLKPTLHATFKGGGWYSRFKTEQGFNQTNKSVDSLKNETIPALKDGLLNSSEKEAVRQSLNVVSTDKKGIDTQYTTVYANTALTGTAKTNLYNSKNALNTAFTNLQSAINAVLGVGDGTRITDTQMALVTSRLNEYGTALSTYNQRYEQAQDAITTEKKRLGDVYAKAQADLAEVTAKSYADGKVSDEEARAIADAQAKLDEAKKYVDDMEVGGRNLLVNSGETITNGVYNIATYDLTIPPSEGDLMTVTIKGELASTKSHFGIYNSGGSISLGSLKSVGGGLYTLTFNWKIGSSSNTKLYVYAFTNAQVGESTIEWIKLEKGNKATDWTKAPEDLEEQIGDKADKETVENISSGIESLQTQILEYATKNEVSLDMAEYQSKLVEIQQSAESGLEKAGDVEAAVNLITNQMGVLAESWVFTNNYIKFAETSDLANISSDAKTKYPDIAVGAMLISNNNGSSKMLLTNNSLFFISNNEVVTAITDSYMNVDRAIFVSSAQIGNHKWSPSTTNEGHFLLEYVKP